MGMFDYILIEQPIDGVELDDEFRPQTKSFDKSMATYIIRDDTLYQRSYEWEKTDEVEVTIGDLKIYKQVLIDTTDVPVDFHGDIHFLAKTKKGDWVRLIARFTEGVLQWIRTEENKG